MHSSSILRASGTALALSALLLSACSDDSTGPEAPLAVELQFAAEVNGQPFSCGSSYASVGTSGTTITPVDFRIYVHNVRLVTSGGVEVPVELEQDGQWQLEDLALLDFENRTGPCANGTPATRTVVRGELPAGDYNGVRFTLGVPRSLNHIDQTTAPAPLDIAALFWSWNGGYKFVRADHISDARPMGWFVHLGSTGCTPGGSPQTVPTGCAQDNRVEVAFSGFNPSSSVVVADLGRLLANSDVTRNEAASGCMSGPTDPECPAVLSRFGIGSPQQFFFSMR